MGTRHSLCLSVPRWPGKGPKEASQQNGLCTACPQASLPGSGRAPLSGCPRALPDNHLQRTTHHEHVFFFFFFFGFRLMKLLVTNPEDDASRTALAAAAAW